MAAKMIFILAPYVADISIFMRSICGRETHCMSVSCGGKNPHTFCSACSKGSMRYDMAAILKPLLLHEVSHMSWGMPLTNVGKRFSMDYQAGR